MIEWQKRVSGYYHCYEEIPGVCWVFSSEPHVAMSVLFHQANRVDILSTPKKEEIYGFMVFFVFFIDSCLKLLKAIGPKWKLWTQPRQAHHSWHASNVHAKDKPQKAMFSQITATCLTTPISFYRHRAHRHRREEIVARQNVSNGGRCLQVEVSYEVSWTLISKWEKNG